MIVILSLAHLAFFAQTRHLLPTIFEDPITAAVVNILNVQLGLIMYVPYNERQMFHDFRILFDIGFQYQVEVISLEFVS